MLLYPIKHVFRNWKLFVALLIGITLAATFFAGIGVKANLAGEQALDKQLSTVLTDMEFQADLNYSNTNLAYKNITNIDGVTQVNMLARFHSTPVSCPSDNYTSVEYAQLASFTNTSRIYTEWTNKPEWGLGVNQTYLIVGSQLANLNISIGDNITTMIQFPTPKYYNTTTIYMNLTVAGFAELTDNGYSLVSGGGYYYTPPSSYGGSGGNYYNSYRSDLMIVSWENTLQKLWAATPPSSTVSVTFSINVDRAKLISPWNVPTSVDNVNVIADNIQNQILGSYLSRGSLNNMLTPALQGFDANFSSTLINFFMVSLPVFFVAWYLGSTVSDVSFNIRRREIGLLSTKGLSSGQIQRMFLTEALVIGLIGGFLGVVGGIALNQYYSGGVNLNTLFTSELFSPAIMVATIIFGVILAITAVFWSSRKASKLPAVDTLRNYMPAELDKPHRKILPLIALILGSYKIVVFALGLNIPVLLSQASFSGGNILLSFVYTPLVLFDAALTFIGPFLFFWGLTKLLIRDSTKFQQLASKISSLMGDLGALAAKNVRRNPARLAAIAFLIALIIGYSVQVTGEIASQQDYTLRQVQAQVGADVMVSVVNSSKAQFIFDDIMANVSSIQNATIERYLNVRLSNNAGSMNVRLINPDSWAVSAHYEDGWFSGNSIDQSLKALGVDNDTIILDRTAAKQLNLKLYDEIAIDFQSCPRSLKIVGFFGPEPTDNRGSNIVYTSSSSGSSFIQSVPQSYYYSQYWSYVPNNLFNVTDGSGIYQLESFNTEILIKLQPSVNGTDIANQITKLEGVEVYGANSFDEQWRQSEAWNNISTFGSLQVLDIQSLGLVFAVLSASVGTALIAIVSLKERSREATLMSVRGLSYRQLVWTFLIESMAIITFSVILGIIVGVIIVYGTVTSANANAYTTALVVQRLIFPPDAVATIGVYVALIYASTIGAIVVMTSQYVTKLEKMVRSR
jgi:ABC-type antimicrobial peptide transport system permease subunit